MQKIIQLVLWCWRILYITTYEFIHDKALQIGAAIAYFTIFSLPPMLGILLSLTHTMVDDQSLQQNIIAYAREISGEAGVKAVSTILNNINYLDATNMSTWLSLGLLIITATGVFIQLQEALNTIWGVRIKSGLGWQRLVLNRIMSFTLVLMMGGIVIFTMILDILLAVFHNFLASFFSVESIIIAIKSMSFGISFIMMTLFFAAIFKILPDVIIEWKDVWLGAFITAALFTMGKYLISLYLSHSHMASAYGAAGSMIIFLFWTFLSALIFLYGAELTEVIALSRGRQIQPDKNAEWIPGYHDRVTQNIAKDFSTDIG